MSTLHKNYITSLLVSAFFILALPFCTAQDPHFSQFYANRVYLNPAYAGFDPGTTITINHRRQWFGIPDGNLNFSDGYQTYNATVDVNLPCIPLDNYNSGLAMSVFRDEAGDAPFITNGVGLGGSLEMHLFGEITGRGKKNLLSTDMSRVEIKRKIRGNIPSENGTLTRIIAGDTVKYKVEGNYLIREGSVRRSSSKSTRSAKSKKRMVKNYGRLRIGFHLNFLNKAISGNYFIYSRQLDPVIGVINDEYRTLNLNSQWFLNLNTGILYRHVRKDKSQWSVGLSLSNVTEPNEYLKGLESDFNLPMRVTLHGGFVKKIIPQEGTQSPTFIAPQLRIDRQASLNLYTTGFYMFSKAYYGGLFYQTNLGVPNLTPQELNQVSIFRNTNALILNLGIDLRALADVGVPWRKRKEGVVLGLTYDFNLTGLSNRNALGSAELSLRVNLDSRKKTGCDAGIRRSELYNGKCFTRF